MTVIKLPLVGPLYQNSDQIATPGSYAPIMYNGYLSEAGSIRKVPGLATFADTGTGQPVNGIFWDYNNSLLLAASNGKFYRYPSSAGTGRIDVSGGITLATQTLRFASYEDANYGGVIFVADGGKLNFLSELPNVVSNGGTNYICIKLHPGSTAQSEPGVGTATATYWVAAAAWSVASVAYTVFQLRTNGGSTYRCDVAHTSAANTEPGVGALWQTVWTQVAPVAWSATNTYYTSGVLEEIADADCPSASSFVTVIDGYVHVNQDNTAQIWFSETNDWQTWAGEYVTAESQGDLIAAIDSGWNQLAVLGYQSFERFENDGVTPWSVNKPASVPSGTIAKYSFCKFDNAWWWLDSNRQFIRLNGTLPQVVSTALAKIMAGITNITDCIVTAVPVDGKPWMLITLPSEGRTWLYDVSQGVNGWSEVADWNSGTAEFEGWKVREWIYSPQWNEVLCAGDDGIIYKVDAETYYFGGTDSIRFERRTGEIDHGTRAWKRSHEVVLKLKRTSRAQEDTDFTMLLDWRDNGSATWSNARTISLTKVGDTEFIAKVNRLGRYRTRQYRLIISDATTDWSLVDAEERVEVDRL